VYLFPCDLRELTLSAAPTEQFPSPSCIFGSVAHRVCSRFLQGGVLSFFHPIPTLFILLIPLDTGPSYFSPKGYKGLSSITIVSLLGHVLHPSVVYVTLPNSYFVASVLTIGGYFLVPPFPNSASPSFPLSLGFGPTEPFSCNFPSNPHPLDFPHEKSTRELASLPFLNHFVSF